MHFRLLVSLVCVSLPRMMACILLPIHTATFVLVVCEIIRMYTLTMVPTLLGHKSRKRHVQMKSCFFCPLDSLKSSAKWLQPKQAVVSRTPRQLASPSTKLVRLSDLEVSCNLLTGLLINICDALWYVCLQVMEIVQDVSAKMCRLAPGLQVHRGHFWFVQDHSQLFPSQIRHHSESFLTVFSVLRCVVQVQPVAPEPGMTPTSTGKLYMPH